METEELLVGEPVKGFDAAEKKNLPRGGGERKGVCFGGCLVLGEGGKKW